MHRRDDNQQESRTRPTATASSGLPPADMGVLSLSRQEHIEPNPGAYRVTPGRSVERASAVDSHSEGTNDESFQGDQANFPPPPPLNQQTSDARTILIEADLVMEEREPLSMLVEATPINRKRQIACILIALLVVIAIIIGIVIGLLRHRPSPTPIPPAFVPLSRNFSSVLPSLTIERLNDTSSPQYRAFQWVEGDRIPSIEAPTNEIARLERMKQRFALATLYYATGGERSWKRNQNWLNTTVSECNWIGTICSTIINEDAGSHTCQGSDRLNALDLSSNSLKQALPDEIGLLTTLSTLNLGNNELEALPTQLGNLMQLLTLDLSNNKLARITTVLGQLSSLMSLDLSYNALHSRIPTQFGLLSNLEDLSLGGNQLSGPIPTEIGRLLRITYISLHSNRISGKLPTELGFLTRLSSLLLADNSISGTIPTQLGHVTTLKELLLFSNRFNGTLPTQLGLLTSLSKLVLANLCFCQVLCHLRLGSCRISKRWKLPVTDSVEPFLPSLAY
jgi:Leucine-rich repeat (LRR) protein